MRLAFFQARKTISLSAPRVLSQIALVLVGVILLSATALSQQVADASLSGTVRSISADPVQNVVIRLQPQDSSKSFTARTDTQGKYKFSSWQTASINSVPVRAAFKMPRYHPSFSEKKEEKTLDLTLGLSKSPEGVAASNQPQFFDEPQFTVAGVTDTTSLGGHGSDTVVRTRENLAKDTMSLGKPSVVASNSADATEKSLREQAERTPSSFDTTIVWVSCWSRMVKGPTPFHSSNAPRRPSPVTTRIPTTWRSLTLTPATTRARAMEQKV